MRSQRVLMFFAAGFLAHSATAQGPPEDVGPPTQDVNVVNTPLLVEEAAVAPFLVSERVQVKTNNPFDDFQLVMSVPEGKTVIVEYVSAIVFGDVQQDEEFELTVTGSALVSGLGPRRPKHHVAKLTRFERVTRSGTTLIQHSGGGPVTTYGVSSLSPIFSASLNIAVTSNIAVGDFQSEPRSLFADIQLSGRLVNGE